jgi:regulator of protease activity HflC (stomatin/prohibitin superfamily)
MPTVQTIAIVSRVLMVLVGCIAVTLVVPQLRRIVLGWLHGKFNADFNYEEAKKDDDGNPVIEDGKPVMIKPLCHRILVKKDDDDEGGGMIPGEKWRNAIRTAIIVAVPEVILLAVAILVLPSYWKVVGIAVTSGLIIISVGLWKMCFHVIKEREVGLVFRKGHLYGFLRPGWYLVARPFGFEEVPWFVVRNRREARDLEVKKVLTSDDLQVGFDLLITMEVMDLHTVAPTEVRHPDSATHPATDTGAPDGAGLLLAKAGDVLPWNLQSPYLRVFRYTSNDELTEEIQKAANTISFLYCISSEWDKLKKMFERPAQTIPAEESETKIKAALAAATPEGDDIPELRDADQRGYASLQQLIRNYLERALYEAGYRIVDVRVKNIIPPEELLETKRAELAGDAELRRLRKVKEALEELGDLANSPAAKFFLTEASIKAFEKAAGQAGTVLITTPEDTLRRLEVNVGSGAS